MIRCHLSRLMGEHKMNVADVARVTGLHRNTITLLYKETATRVDLDAIDRLCELCGCKVGVVREGAGIEEIGYGDSGAHAWGQSRIKNYVPE